MGVQLLVILVALVAFWAIIMRPARVQQKQVAALQEGLTAGDEVVLSSGIFGTIHSLSETRVELEIAPGTVVTVARQVVVRRADAIAEPHDHTDVPDDQPQADDADRHGEPGPTKAED